MYPAICNYDEQAFDYVSEESENNNFIVEKLLWPVSSQGMVEQAKKTWRLQTPARLPRKHLKNPDSEMAEDRLMKDIIK